MKLTYDAAIRLHKALQRLDSSNFVVDDERVPARIAITLNRLEQHVKHFDKRQRAIRKEVFGHENPVPPTDPKMTEFSDKIQAVLDTEIPEEVKVLQCKLTELKVKENGISGPVLAGLALFISDFESVE